MYPALEGGKAVIAVCVIVELYRRRFQMWSVVRETSSSYRKRKKQSEFVDNKNMKPSTDYVKAPPHIGQVVSASPTPMCLKPLPNPATIHTATCGKEFKRTVSMFSNEKIIAILEMGFGPLYQFCCSKLNRALCQMLVDNFDVSS
ncbi:hypothetical protein M0R45_001285 [Rubus argutus]|uniref:Uncharacterized protein n=1 Tax=Rubus argutus TaxID=59490 RepID=A0AAW1VHJ8_RUBAR